MLIKTASLTPNVLHIVKDKGTELPFTSTEKNASSPGTYLCRQCGHALFRTHMQFQSQCGWPSFDDEIVGAVTRQPDRDGQRTEIVCAACSAHLGHVFEGEGYTSHNLRHCVNSASLDFVANSHVMTTEEAIFASGCFWGIESQFKQLQGVVKTQVGYTGGQTLYPTYEEVCSGKTGHVEAIRVVYDPNIISFAQVTQYFFKIHNPTQFGGQGVDIGSQYRSVIFYYEKEQHNIALSLIQQFTKTLGTIATQVLPVRIFWPAEDYHQDYYAQTGRKFC